jgi:hypothetical protein
MNTTEIINAVKNAWDVAKEPQSRIKINGEHECECDLDVGVICYACSRVYFMYTVHNELVRLKDIEDKCPHTRDNYAVTQGINLYTTFKGEILDCVVVSIGEPDYGDLECPLILRYGGDEKIKAFASECYYKKENCEVY